MKKILLFAILPLLFLLNSCNNTSFNSQNQKKAESNPLDVQSIRVGDLYIPISPFEMPQPEIEFLSITEAFKEYYSLRSFVDPNFIYTDPNSRIGDADIKFFKTWFSDIYNPRMEKYKNIIKEEKICPVYVMNFDYFIFVFLKQYSLQKYPYQTNIQNSSVVNKLMGLYIPENSIEGWPNEFIFINKDMSSSSIMATFFHETQHAICKRTHCECTKSRSSCAAEAHAIEAEIRIAMKHDLPEVVITGIKDISIYAQEDDLSSYKVAANHVMATPTYSRAVEYISSFNKKKNIDFQILLKEYKEKNK